MIFSENYFYFSIIVIFAGYVQTVTGFGFGLVVLGASVVFGLADITDAAFVISVLSLANCLMSLKQMKVDDVNKRTTSLMLTTSLPFLAVGLWLLYHLNSESTEILRLLLGATLVVSCGSLIFKPKPRTEPYSTLSFLGTGVMAGLLGGLFSTAGAAYAFSMYRQPFSLNSIKSTLFTLFAANCVLRILLVVIFFMPVLKSWILVLVCFPAVFIGTKLAQVLPSPFSDLTTRRIAFAMLCVIGALLISNALRSLGLLS